MKLTQKYFDETDLLADLVRKIDGIDAEYVNSVSDEIFKQQPFFLSVLLGYTFDVSKIELEEIMKIYFLIWEYFKTNKRIPNKKITAGQFEKIQKRNIQMLKFSEGEPTQTDKMNVYSLDLQNLKSKSLLSAILYRYQNRAVLRKMDIEKKGIILIGIKSFIECFETI